MHSRRNRKVRFITLGALLLCVLLVADYALRQWNFGYAAFRSKDLSGTTWWRADINNTNLTSYKLRGAIFPESDLIGANLSGIDLTKSRFRGANLTNAKLQNSVLRGADFWGCTLAFADLRGADLQGAKLRQSVVADADLRGAKLKGANLANCRYTANTRWPAGFNPKQHGATLLTFSWPTDMKPRNWGFFKGIFSEH